MMRKIIWKFKDEQNNLHNLSGGEEHLFYLRSKNKGLWMVGPSAGQFNGGLAHRWVLTSMNKLLKRRASVGVTLTQSDVFTTNCRGWDGSQWLQIQLQILLIISAEQSSHVRPENNRLMHYLESQWWLILCVDTESNS